MNSIKKKILNFYTIALTSLGLAIALAACSSGGGSSSNSSGNNIGLSGSGNIKAIIYTDKGINPSLILKNDGTVWAFGGLSDVTQACDCTIDTNNIITHTEVGYNYPNNYSYTLTAKQITSLGSNAIAIASSDRHSLILKNDGSVWAFGINSSGELGLGTISNSYTKPTRIINLGYDNKAVAAGGGARCCYSLVLKNDGSVWSFGNNEYGQLGLGTTQDTSTPTRIISLGYDVKEIIANSGSETSLALKNDGSLWAFGSNYFDFMNLGSSANVLKPTMIANFGSDIQTIASNGQSILALKTGGTVWAFGDNSYGQLGLGNISGNQLNVNVTPNYVKTPTQVSGLSDIKAIFTDRGSSALKQDGSLYAFGNAFRKNSYSSTITRVNSFGTDIQLVDDKNTTILKKDGSLWIYYFGDVFDNQGIDSPSGEVSLHRVTVP